MIVTIVMVALERMVSMMTDGEDDGGGGGGDGDVGSGSGDGEGGGDHDGMEMVMVVVVMITDTVRTMMTVGKYDNGYCDVLTEMVIIMIGVLIAAIGL